MKASAVRAFSYGGGVQSTAALVLAAQGRIDFPTFLFAEVGDDSENPDTLDYVAQVAQPFAATHGIELVRLAKVLRTGETDTLMRFIERQKSSVPIPMRMSNGAPGNRKCTGTFKIAVVAAELKRRGASREKPATVGLGISLDEWQRARSDSGVPHELLAYPLLDLRLTRHDCVEVIRRAGLPIPPKSACFFCPFQSVEQWQQLGRRRPELFARSVQLEAEMNARRRAMGRDEVWLTRFGRPLDTVATKEARWP